MYGLTPFFEARAAGHFANLLGRNNVPNLLDVYAECDDFPRFHAVQTIDGTNTLADWVVTKATNGTADVIDGFGGILQLDSDSTTADQGVQVQRRVETFKPSASSVILFEAKLSVVDTIDKVQLFAGLSVLDTTLFASGEIDASDYIGFVLDATEQAGSNAGKPALQLDSTSGSEEKLSAVASLAEDTFFRLGFLLEGTSRLTPLVDGVPGEVLSISNCPTTELAVSFACLSEGTNDPIAKVDWYYSIQLR